MDTFQKVFAKFNLENDVENYENFLKEFNDVYDNEILKIKKVKVKEDSPKIRCEGITKKGEQCKKKASDDNKFCKIHQKSETNTVSKPVSITVKCNGITTKGVPCSNNGTKKSDESDSDFKYCFRHIKNWKKFEE